MWYLLADDGTLILTTLSRNQKVKNLRRDPRMTFCVGDKTRSVSLSGPVTISEDQAVVRQDLERLVERYVKDESVRPRVVASWIQQSHVALDLSPKGSPSSPCHRCIDSAEWTSGLRCIWWVPGTRNHLANRDINLATGL